MPLFDRIIMVDWSAASVPTIGRDSIWIAVAENGELVSEPENIATRTQAMERLVEIAEGHVLIGFDFAFGYPTGTALRFGASSWTTIWSWLARELHDEPNNANNRFAVAARFNEHFSEADGPLWGCPPNVTRGGLVPTKPNRMPNGIASRRHVELLVPKAQPVWKLAYPGSVGSQVLTGIVRLEEWRRDARTGDDTSIWPFETMFADELGSRIVLAEIYPSLHPITVAENEAKDCAQVRALAIGYSRLDAANELRAHLAGPSDNTVREDVIREEGWIMSVGDAPMPLAA